MPGEQTIEIVAQILQNNGIVNLADLKEWQDAKQFIQICSDIVKQMIVALLNGPERRLPEGVLEAIEADLLKVTKALVEIRNTPLWNLYKLSDLELKIDSARGKISGAIGEYQKIETRVTYIQECRRELENTQELIEDFSAVDIPSQNEEK